MGIYLVGALSLVLLIPILLCLRKVKQPVLLKLYSILKLKLFYNSLHRFCLHSYLRFFSSASLTLAFMTATSVENSVYLLVLLFAIVYPILMAVFSLEGKHIDSEKHASFY